MSILKNDLIKFHLKYDNGFTQISLELYLLDVLRMMEVLKKSRNIYYYNQLRWFVDQVSRTDKCVGILDFKRKLPRLCIKEKKTWELEEMLREE